MMSIQVVLGRQNVMAGYKNDVCDQDARVLQGPAPLRTRSLVHESLRGSGVERICPSEMCDPQTI